jgi:polar amino acid transport system substrate-binding protein
MKRSMLTAAFTLLLILLTSCSSSKDQIRILTEDYPPLSFMAEGEVTGYGTDVVNAIQAELGTDYPISLQSWDTAYTTALTEANVLLYTIDKTPEREARFHFIGPLGSNVASFYTYSNNEITIADLAAAKAVDKIATTTNWFTEQHLIELGFENLESMSDPLQTIRLLVDKKADLAVFTDITLPNLLAEAEIDPQSLKPVMELMSTDYYIALSLDTLSETVEQWQQAFEEVKNKGVLKELRTKWFDLQ